MSFAFLSHSSSDKGLVEKLAERLGQENVFFDTWNLDYGKYLPSEIAKGVYESKWFILIASKKAMESHWVKYEINLAVIRSIQENDFNIIVAKIEDCEIHPELSPYLFVNYPDNPSMAIDKIAKIIQSKGRGIIPKKADWQKNIVDRNDELDGIEAAALEGLNIIFMSGTYGIGKSTLAEHATVRLFQKHLARFPLTRGHDTLRLVLEMAGRAKMPLAEPDASKETLLSLAQESVVKDHTVGIKYMRFICYLTRDSNGEKRAKA